MKGYIRSRVVLAAIYLLMLSTFADASTPTMTISVPTPAIDSSMEIGNTQSFQYTLTNLAPQPQNVNSVSFNPTTDLVNESTTNNCPNSAVPANGSCIITVTLHAIKAGTLTQNLMVYYGARNQFIVPEPVISTTIAGGDDTLSYTVQPNATNMQTNGSQTLIYTVINNSTSNTITMNSETVSADPLITSATATPDCSGGVVAAQGTCNITVVLNAGSSPGTVSNQTLTINYGTNGSTLVSDPLSYFVTIGATATQRLVTFINKCDEPVWAGVHGSSSNSITGPGATCTSNSDCYSGQTCLTVSQGNSQCFWPDPVIKAGDSFKLNPGGSDAFIIPVVTAPDPDPTGIQFIGTFTGRLDCDANGDNCKVGDCNSTNGVCKAGQGFDSHSTLAEITMQNPTDSYDLTLVNGVSLPMSFAPSNGVTTTNPYTCGAAGGSATTGSGNKQLAGCNWDFKLPATDPRAFVWVSSITGAQTCSNSNTTCPTGQVCGVTTANIQSSNTPVYTCGKFYGYWNGDEVCGMNANFGAPYNCKTNAGLASPYTSLTFTNMYSCQSTGTTAPAFGSCYSNGAQNNQCCGCQNWQSSPTNLTVPSDPTVVAQCNASSTSWVSNVLPNLSWIKAACPSAYVYPFDDKSSSYTCSNNTTNNLVNYTVTFCPTGDNGTPT